MSEGVSPKKPKRQVTSAMLRGKEVIELPKQFLSLTLDELRGFEISPKGSYIVFNAGNHVFIQTIVVCEKLIKVMRPHYLTIPTGLQVTPGLILSDISGSLVEQQVESTQEQLRLLIRKMFK